MEKLSLKIKIKLDEATDHAKHGINLESRSFFTGKCHAFASVLQMIEECEGNKQAYTESKYNKPDVTNFVCGAPKSFLPCNVNDNGICKLPTHCDYHEIPSDRIEWLFDAAKLDIESKRNITIAGNWYNHIWGIRPILRYFQKTRMYKLKSK